MLILTRRVGEALHIGEQVVVKVLSVRGGQVRLGIDAPREIKVNRDEVVNPRSKQQERRPEPRQRPEESTAETAPSAEAEAEVKAEETAAPEEAAAPEEVPESAAESLPEENTDEEST